MRSSSPSCHHPHQLHWNTCIVSDYFCHCHFEVELRIILKGHSGWSAEREPAEGVFRLKKQLTNRPTRLPTNQPINQPTNRPSKQSTKHSIQPTKQLTKRPTSSQGFIWKPEPPSQALPISHCSISPSTNHLVIKATFPAVSNGHSSSNIDFRFWNRS